MSYRSSSPPVSGFAGHIPGNKWQVGSNKSFNPSSENNSQSRSLRIEPEATVLSDHSHTFDFEGNPISRFTPYFIPPPMTPAEYTQYYNQQMANFQAGASSGGAGAMMQQYSNNPMQMYGFNPALSMNGYQQNGVGMASSASMQGINNQQISPSGNHQNSVNGQSNGQSQGQQSQQQKSRSKSMPRKPKSDVRDMFGGIESGWWSEGQALKNIRRHQQSQAEASGVSATNSNNTFGNDHTLSSSTTNSRFRRRANNDADRDFDDDDVPAPGYSGFIPGIKTHGVGKPFTVAAKESRRIMHENHTQSSIQPKGRSDKDQGNSSQQQQQNNSQNALRQGQQQQFTPSINGFPQQQQQAFMNSYPFMTPNGMMQQPMYMGLPQQGQPQINLPNNNINPPEF